jgi:hypothetical protein
MQEYFYSDYMGYNWTLKDGADELIMEKTASLVHLVADDKATTLPALREAVIRFDLSPQTRVKYEEMKKHMVVDEISAANSAVASGKLRQLASGFLYAGNHDRSTEHYSRERLSVVQKWARSLKGKPGLVFYEFIQQAEWADAMPNNITFVQINSMSHGVDGLQHIFADMLFVQPCWSRDMRQQAIGRVWRQGQTEEVTVTTLIANDTLDDVVVARVEGNAKWMALFRKHLKG